MQTQQRDFADGERTNARLGRGLGAFSVGLGLAELAAPRAVAKLIGVEDAAATRTTLRLFGARELMSAVLLLVKPRSAAGPWTRVLGDAIDLAALVLALRSRSVARGRTIGALASVAGVMALDAYAGVRQRRNTLLEPVRRAITIGLPPEQVYAAWRNFERLPMFMRWVESVREIDRVRSHWRVKTPGGAVIEYDAVITDDEPGRRIAWQSMPGATVANRGSVSFEPAAGDRGTDVIVELQVAAPLGKTIAASEVMGDLRRFKQILETGEVLLSDASMHERPHPAQPMGGR